MTKSPNVIMYGIFLPMTGISLNGEKINGPVPSKINQNLEYETYNQEHTKQDQAMQQLRKLRISP